MSASLKTIEAVLDHLHNHFSRGSATGTYSVSGGVPSPAIEGQAGQYYWIRGSVFNDGLHMIGGIDLTDEQAAPIGIDLTDEQAAPMTVNLLAVPLALLEICDEIEDWQAANAQAMQKAAESPYTSESFGGYTYQLKDGTAAQNGSDGLSGWQLAFKSRLDRWRKL